MKYKYYVTCSVCKHRYAGKIPKGGDGSVLFPRKHTRHIPHITKLGISVRVGYKETCPGSYKDAEDFITEVEAIEELRKDELV